MRVATRPPIRRVLLLDRMIREGRYPNARSAAKELEIHPRTVHRDLALLRESFGAPLEYSAKRNGFYYRDQTFALPLLQLTEGELLALFLAERVLQEFQGTPYAGDLSRAFRKLTRSLPEQVTIDLEHLEAGYSFRNWPVTANDVATFQQLCKAVRKGRQLELVYWSASRDATSRRVVDPYHLASLEGGWYLIGYCHSREEVRMFVPARIRVLRETGERIERPADFSIADYLDGSFRVMRGSDGPQQVRLRFSPSAARFVQEKTWHPSQKISKQRDGGIILTMKVTHLVEVKRWALSFGVECEAIAPRQLRDEIKQELVRLFGRYS
ncbi:MAG: helix-turn-helix transcriptional regulator [Gemmataceae bacterium]